MPGLASLPAWMSSALIAVGATDTASVTHLAAIEGTLNANGYMPQRSSGCNVRLRLYGGPLVTSFCSHPSVDFNQPYETVDVLAAGGIQWDWLSHGTGGGGGGGGAGGCSGGGVTGVQGLKVERIHFQIKSGAAGFQLVSVTDPGFVPKAFIFTNVFVGSSANPDPTFANTNNPGSAGNFSIGLDDGTNAGGFANANGNVFGSDNTVTVSSDAGSIIACQNIPILINALRVFGRVTCLGTGQFGVTTTTNDGHNVWIEALVLGGDNFNAKVLFFEPSGLGVTAPIAVGFETRAIVAVGCRHARGADQRSAGNQTGFGWSVKCDGEGCCVAGSDDGLTVAASYQRATRLCALVNATAGSVASEIAVSAWGTTDITLDVIANAAPTYYTLLCLGGDIAANAFMFTQGDTSIPYHMKRPKAMLVGSIGKVAGTTVRRDANLCFGMATNPQSPTNLVGKFNTSNVAHITKDASGLSLAKEEDLIGLGGIYVLEPVATVTLDEATGYGTRVVTGHGLVTALASQLASATWTIDDAGGREIAALMLGDDVTGTHPCGEVDLTPLTVACALGVGGLGVPYSSAFAAVGGTSPYSFAITAGALPTGLVLDGATGAVTGTPTTVGLFAYTVEVTDAVSDTSTASCEILITGVGSCVPPPGSSTPGSALEIF